MYEYVDDAYLNRSNGCCEKLLLQIMNRIRKNSSQCINSTSNCKTCNCWSNVTYSCCELLKLKSSCQHHTSARMHAVRQQRWFLFKLNWSCCVCVADRLSSVWLLTSAPLNFEESTSLLRSMHSSVCIVLTMLISEWSSAGGVVCWWFCCCRYNALTTYVNIYVNDVKLCSRHRYEVL